MLGFGSPTKELRFRKESVKGHPATAVRNKGFFQKSLWMPKTVT
jgi:hypothetical protein